MAERTLDHVALVVADLEATARWYVEALGFREAYRETVAEQGVRIVGIDAGSAVIELLEPLSKDSPIERFRGDAKSRLHHIAYRVDDIAVELARLKASGLRLIDETPRKGAHGNTIAFLHPKSTGGVLTELCERSER
ncbi:MAG: methylmalonyl-CoA epimerase [Candidatus Eremiobacteraeota bacterium]|nr:methylmalonyl-CoA epimerase [Candidatus Eremiobacteraeota bacterium]